MKIIPKGFGAFLMKTMKFTGNKQVCINFQIFLQYSKFKTIVLVFMLFFVLFLEQMHTGLSTVNSHSLGQTT